MSRTHLDWSDAVEVRLWLHRMQLDLFGVEIEPPK